MKAIFGEYYKIVMYTIFGLMIVLSSYTIILNIHHFKSLRNTAVVSEIDINYKKYMDNVTKLEEKTQKISKDNAMYKSLSNAVNILKKDGVFRLIPNSKLGYRDLYELNEYFIEKLINSSWVTDMKKLSISNKYDEEISLLINNSNYINSVFIKNGLILYDDNNSHKIVDDYHLIVNNYMMYSSILLDICNSVEA